MMPWPIFFLSCAVGMVMMTVIILWLAATIGLLKKLIELEQERKNRSPSIIAYIPKERIRERKKA